MKIDSTTDKFERTKHTFKQQDDNSVLHMSSDVCFIPELVSLLIYPNT